MKQFTQVNNSKGLIRTLVGLKSRITLTYPLLTMLFMLVLGGWNSEAWGAVPVYNGSTWYSLYKTDQGDKIKDGTILEYTDVFAPTNTQCIFQHRRYARLSTNSNIDIKTGVGDGDYTYRDNVSASSYSGWNTYNKTKLPANITKILLEKTSGTGASAKNLQIPLAQHILLNDGTTFGTDKLTPEIPNTSLETTSDAIPINFRSFLTAGNISITLSDANGVFSIGSATNTSNTISSSTAGKSYNVGANACAAVGGSNAQCATGKLGNIANYSFNVYFRPKAATTYNATITITDGSSTATVTLSGTGVKLQPEVTWSSNDDYFNVDDVLGATNSNGLTVTLSGNSTYVTCKDNTATMKAATSGTITITAHVTGNDLYADRDITKDITITNLQKQFITWTQDFSRLKTTDGTKSITLSATASSGQPVSYALVGDKTGLTLSQSGNTWTLTYSATECKNTTIVASQGGNSTYAPASSVSLPVKVVDPKKVCDASTVLVNSQLSIKNSSVTYNIDIPETMTVSFSRMKTGLFDIYLNGLNVEFYSGRNGTGTKLYTKEYSASNINNSLSNDNINLSEYINAKSVKITTEATNGYYIDAVSYTHQKYCTISESSLAFETYPNTTPSAKIFNVNYANYPIFVECSNAKITVSPTEFGDCGEYGTQAISVSYTAGPDEGEDSGVITIKDNTGVTLKTCSLSVVISKVGQSVTSTNIKSSYNTTDRVELSAVANSGLTNFVYTASPEGVASFDGNVMTFSQSGTIAITATQPGTNVYASASTTVENVVVNKVTPAIATEPNVATIKYKDNLVNGVGCQLSGGKATVTLRGVANTEVAGTFTWKNAGQVTDAAGSHDYSVTFTPTNGGMYSSTTFTMPVTISRADGAIQMKNGNVKVKITGINDDLNECKINLNGLVESKIEDTGRAGAVSFEVIGDNKANAGIENGVFSATAVGAYSVVATQAQTSYYKEAKDTFTITVNKLTPTIVFDNTDDPEIVYSGDVIEKPAYRKYNGKEIDRVVSYVSSDPSNTGAIHVAGTTLTARNVTAPEGSSVNVTITASTTADALYNAASATAIHNYAVRAKRSPVFTMEGVDNAPVSKTLNIGEQAIITYNEHTNEFLTVGTASEHSYVSYVHEPANRRIVVTAVKGTIVGDGVQEIIVNQPGNDYLFPRNITYTFTVKRNVSALSLAGLTSSMEVEDTVATPYTGLANTAEDVQFSCSPEGSMKMENGKLIALAAGTNTVTFSQPATEYWTGISRSKTITVSRKDPNVTTALANRHPWYSIIEHPFSSLNTEKELQITSSNESLAKYIKEEDKIYVYGTSGNVTFTVNQDANYKYNAVVNYEKTFTIFQPNNRLPFTLTSGNLEDYNGGSKGGVSWNGNGVVVGSPDAWDKSMDWSAKYIILKFVGVPDKLSFDFENTVSIATQYGWHFYQSSNGKDWNLIKEYQDLLMNASGGTSSGSESNLQLDPATQYIKLEYHGNYGGRFKNVHVTERKEIAPKAATTDFGLGYNGNDPTSRTIKVDWYNVKPCTVTITGTDADKFVLDEGSKTINSTLDHYGTVDLLVSYKHETNSETTHTATLHIEDADGKYADVTLTGQTTPAPQTIIWRSDLTPMPIEGSFQNAAMVTTGQAVTLVSNHPEIVRVVNNTTLEPVSAGTARVTATAEGNDKWAETTDYLDIEVTTLKVQYITWTDNLSNRKREDGQTVNITLTATSSAGLPITYELDKAAQVFASISGNVLSLTGWGNGQVIAKQVGTEEYVAVQATKGLVSRNPNAKCRPLVGEYKDEYTLHTLAVKEIPIYGEADSVTFWAKCDWNALYGMWVAEEYNGSYHDIQEISRLGDPNITSDYQHYSFPLHRNATAVKLYTKTGATMTRTFKEVEVVLAKYLELADNHMNFSQVDKGSTKTQSFYINYSNLTGVLDVEMENKTNTHFTVVTTTVGEDCGDIGQNVRIDISYTGSTLGDEENAILVHNADQSLRIPVSASVVLPSQTITWEPDVNVLTTDEVVLSATATSELPVSFTSGNNEIAEVVYEAGVYSLDIKSYGDVEITAHQTGNEDWSAATDKKLTYHISREVPVINTWPTAQVILPNTVGNATIIGGVKPEGIPGSFIWEDGSQTVTRQEHTFNVVFMPDNTNYYEPVEYALEIEILKTPQTISWAREDVSEEGCSDVVILDATASSGLPITYHSSDSTKAYVVDAVISEMAVKKLYILKGGDVTITAVQPGDETYAAAPFVSKTITLIRVIPTIETLPIATDMYVHHFLSNSTPQGGVVKAGANTVTGVFNWANGAELMDDPGTNQRTVVFHPYNSDFYQEVSAVINVEVQRFAPTIIHNFTTETKVYGTKLSEFTINGSGKGYDYTDPAHYEIEGTFAWKDENHIPSVSDAYATMVFHPTHTEWYDDVEIEVPITITKATIVSATATATMFYGQVLGDAVLTNITTGIVNNAIGVVAGTVTWDSSLDLMEYYSLGTHENLPIRFTPTDPNYEPVEIAGTAVLTVNAGYVFDGKVSTTWDDDENWRGNEVPEGSENVVILADVDVAGAVSVDAMTIKEGVTVTVKDGAVLTVGDEDSYYRSTYGNLHVENGGKVILNEGELKVNNFVLEASIGDMSRPASSGEVNGEEQLKVEGEAYFQISFDPSGHISSGWYDFTVPFEVDELNGVYDSLGNKLTNNVDYAIMEFSEERRATNSGRPWIWFTGTMQPGKLYTITLDDEKDWNTFLFKKKAGSNVLGVNSYAASCSNNGETTDRGWNGLGNGTLQHCQLNSLPAETKIQVNDHTNRCYVQKEASEYTYAVGTAFFVQVPTVQNIDLTTVIETRGFLAPAREARTVNEFRLALKAEDESVSDHLWVSASEEATGEYTIGHDLLKMGTPTDAKVAQMWTMRDNMMLCDIEMILNANKANTNLSLYAPAAGLYTLEIEKTPADATLYLTKNGRVIWNLSMSPYDVELSKGTTTEYGLRIIAETPQISTDIENGGLLNGADGVRKVLIDDKIYIITPEGKMYDIVGKGVNF